jgi:Rieske Fe-S protein
MACRRIFIQQVSISTVSLLISGCKWFELPEIRVGTLAQLASAGFLETEFNGQTIHTRLDSITNKPYTLSLVCTHKACTVRWQAADNQFVCPCHQGKYTAQGVVISGKPPAPLSKLVTQIRNTNEIWVLNQLEITTE